MRLILYRGKYTVTWNDGKQRRYSLRTDNESIAKQRFEDFKVKYYATPETVQDVCDKWVKEKSELKGIRQAKAKLKQICRHIGDLKHNQINRDVCKRYIKTRLKEGVRESTIRNELVGLRAAVRYSYPNSDNTYYMPPSPPPRERYLTRDEFKHLVDSIETFHIKLFTMIALYTGARSNAVLELKWDRVDFDRKLINLSTGDHGNKGRAIVPISDKLMPILKEAYKGRTCDHVISFNDKPLQSIRWGFSRNAKKAGFNDVSPHVLRHTAAVWMAEAGVPMSEIAQFLGHKTSAITEKVYARYSPEYLRGAADAL